MLYGRSTGLSPISVVISAIFWGWLWGPVSLILSTPLTLCLVVLGRHVKQLEFLNVLFGDQPALTRIESLTSECWPATQTRCRSMRKSCSRRCHFRRTTMRSR